MTNNSKMGKCNQTWLLIFKIYRFSPFFWYEYHSNRPTITRDIIIWKRQIFVILLEITARPIINKWAFLRFSRFFTQKRECSLAILLQKLKEYIHRYLQKKIERNPSSSFRDTDNWNFSTFCLATTLPFDRSRSNFFSGLRIGHSMSVVNLSRLRSFFVEISMPEIFYVISRISIWCHMTMWHHGHVTL